MKLKKMMFMKNFIKKKELLDFSDYLKASQFFDRVNKTSIGKTKNEVKGKNN